MPHNPTRIRRAAASLTRDLTDETIHIASNPSEDARPWSSLCGSATGTILPTSLTATCPVCLRKAGRRVADYKGVLITPQGLKDVLDLAREEVHTRRACLSRSDDTSDLDTFDNLLDCFEHMLPLYAAAASLLQGCRAAYLHAATDKVRHVMGSDYEEAFAPIRDALAELRNAEQLTR